MDIEEQFTSITIRNIPLEAKKNFELLCNNHGWTVQEALRRYIMSTAPVNEIAVITNTAYGLCYNNPQLVDKFIEEREPLYISVNDPLQKANIRSSFVRSNPSYIFQRYAQELKTRQDTP